MQVIKPLLLVGVLPVAAAFKAKYPDGVAAQIDELVSPCDDFYKYACGGWLKSHDIPSDRPGITYSFDTIADTNRAVLLDIFHQGKPLIGELFQSCMNMEALNKAGNKPVKAVRKQIADVKTRKELFKIAGQISSYGPNFLSGIHVGANPKDATRNILAFGQADSTFTQREEDQLEDDFESEFRKYVVKLYMLNGESQQKADYFAKVVIQLETQVQTFHVHKQDVRDPIKSYNPMKFNEVSTKYPNTFGEYIVKGLQLLKTTSVKPTDTVVVTTPSYFEKVENFIDHTDLSLLKVYLDYTYLNFAAKYLGQDFLDARFDFNGKYLNGQQMPSNRERVCAQIVQTSFPDLVGKYFFEAKFNTQSQNTAQKMIELIEKSMEKRMTELTWLDDATRQQAIKKLSQVANLIGHSETVEAFRATLDPTDFFKNVLAIRDFGTKRALAQINTPVDRKEWGMSGAEINAYYQATSNQIVFPAGFLQPPFFSDDFHPVQNFGSIGVVMGHELTHGFDNSGRHYDGEGNLHQWWTNATNADFEMRTKCLVGQYSAFQSKSIVDPSVVIGNVDGILTLGENIADNGGFGLAFDAFHTYLSETQPTTAKLSDDYSIQDLERTFFLSYAQTWCSKSTAGLAKQRLRDKHSPNEFRVIGVVQNSPFFGDLFECALGTPMNPTEKCQLW